jgi:FkbH-like protein
MLLRLSRFVHLLPVGDGRMLVVDAVSHVRLTVNDQVAAIIRDFSTPRQLDQPPPADSLVAALLARGILTEKTPEEELSHVTGLLSPYLGRDPEVLLEQYRLKAKQGVDAYFAASVALTPEDFGAKKHRAALLLFGDCDVQVEADFLRREAARRDIDLQVAASFPDDLRLAAERKHDAILIGALRQRFAIPENDDEVPHARFIAEARVLLDGLRQNSAAPILIDNLPEPTVEPLGMADRGVRGHRNRFRAANLALAELAQRYSDVHVVDIAGVLNAVGAERMLDDGLMAYAHFGSPGWLLQRPEKEKVTVHNIFPDLTAFAQTLGGDPYLREKVTARAHINDLMTVLAIDRKKCVIVDLDGVLWPGVLAETGSPFAWRPDISSPYSYVGLYFGLHDALLALKKRGILLACVSKNDEATVRELWKYEEHYSIVPLLTPDDFVTWRVNWNDKVDNIRSIADQLGLALESFLFLDDNPVERDRVRQRLPEVEVWGEDPFTLRRQLLSDPRLQTPSLTAESAARTQLAKAQLGRQSARAESVSETDFLATLNVETRVKPMEAGDAARVAELFQRTTQFNTNGAKFSAAELETLLRDPAARVFTVHVKDRFGDHGLVGAAVIRGGEIVGLVLSCRVLGMGVEHEFLRAIIGATARDQPVLSGRIIETARNIPVRNIYRDHGFVQEGGAPEGKIWRRTLEQVIAT